VKIAEAQAEEEARQGVRSVRECIEQYLADLERRGIRAKSIVTFRHMLHRFFAPALDDSLARVGTPHRAATLYEQLRTSVGQRTGRTLATDTHKNMLTTARTFLGWCVDRHWLKDNPLARVKGVGHKRKGKPTLLVDSSRTFLHVALREAAAGDDGALAALIGIALGLRAGEVVSRLARDVDAGATVLQVQDTPEYGWCLKTGQSKRPLGIPPYLQPLLRARAAGKEPTDLLFPSAVGRLQWPSWCNRQVARLCKLAGVPRVCMHSLRATAATNSITAGVSPEAAARMLGHKNTGMISGAYVPAHVIDQAARERGMEALLSGLPSGAAPSSPA
jgi:integrase